MEKITHYTKDKYVIVLSGYSGLEFANPALLKSHIAAILLDAAKQHGASNVILVAGGTPNGIGISYEVANKLNPDIHVLGIVSEEGKAYGVSSYCKSHDGQEAIVYVPDPEKSWEVKTPDGKRSYMTLAATAGETLGSSFYALGGGDVAQAELKEIRQNLDPKQVFEYKYEPNPTKLQNRVDSDKAKGKNISLASYTPIFSSPTAIDPPADLPPFSG